MNYVSWFSFLYIVAAYVRMNPIKKRKWGLWTGFFIIVASLSVIACLYLGVKLDKRLAYEFVSDSNTFLAFAVGFCSFMFFKDLKIKQSRLVNAVGGSTFGVLCIHANSNTMRKWLWGTVLNVKVAYSLPFGELVLFSGISVLTVFVMCSMIDMARQRIVEKKILNWIEKTSVFRKINERFEMI